MHRCLANLYCAKKGVNVVRWAIQLQERCMKLTRKSVKRGQREPVSPVVDAEDLYRRYLRIRAEREYFRERDGVD